MKFVKRRLCEMKSSYAVSHIERGGRTIILFAPDSRGPCYGFDSQTFEREPIWEEPGGTMAIVPLPDANGDFLAVQRFNPGFQAQDAEIVLARHRGGEWRIEPFLKLPYVHRFDILQRGDIRYLLCCTLCTTKKDLDDWSSPGGLYAAELPSDMKPPANLTRIAGGMTKNHGYWRVQNEGYTSALTSCDQGVFIVSPPPQKGGEWAVRNILDKPVSDIALCDIDHDGVDELATIEPFHGNVFTVYRKNSLGYSPLYRHPGKADFYHVAWGGVFEGEAVFIGGSRAGSRELFLLRWKNGAIAAETLDTGLGPANVDVVRSGKRDLIIAANREAGEGAIYSVAYD